MSFVSPLLISLLLCDLFCVFFVILFPSVNPVVGILLVSFVPCDSPSLDLDSAAAVPL